MTTYDAVKTAIISARDVLELSGIKESHIRIELTLEDWKELVRQAGDQFIPDCDHPNVATMQFFDATVEGTLANHLHQPG